MKPISPTVPGKNFPEVKVAEHQKEYQTLPGIYLDNGNILLSRWELEDKEVEDIVKNKYLYLYLYTFRKPVTPVLLSTDLIEIYKASKVEDARKEFLVQLLTEFLSDLYNQDLVEDTQDSSDRKSFETLAREYLQKEKK